MDLEGFDSNESSPLTVLKVEDDADLDVMIPASSTLSKEELPNEILAAFEADLTGFDDAENDNHKFIDDVDKMLVEDVPVNTVSLLNKYVQQSLRTNVYFSFTKLDDQATTAVVRIKDIEYGRGTGRNKKVAKSKAARRTLEMLIPEIKDKLPGLSGEAGLSFFDEIRVEDPRLADLCNTLSVPAPYQILIKYLQRNYSMGDIHIHQGMKIVRDGKYEYRLLVGKREVIVICKNKKDGKQLAAQKFLQQLHPNINSWGEILRMYSNRYQSTVYSRPGLP